MSSGGRGTYSITIHVDAAQAQATINNLIGQMGRLGPSFTQAGGAINQAGMQFTRFNTEAQRTVGTSSALAGGLGQLRGPLGQLNSQINTTATTLPKLSQAQQQAAQGANKLGQSMQGTIQRMTALGSRIGGIAFMFTGLTAAMGEAQGMQSLLADTQKKADAAQVKYTEAVRKHGKESFQATRALEQFEKAERAVTFQSRIATLSIQDQFFFIGGLASIALPSVITAIGKMVQAMKTAEAAGKSFGSVITTAFSGLGDKLAAGINAVVTGLNRLTPGFAAASTASAAFATNTTRNATALSTYTIATGTAAAGTRTLGASLTMLATHPVVLTITALVTAFVLLQNNVFGVTDRIREFGIALGQAIPVLQPLLDLIDGIGASLGITGEAAVNAGERFQSAMEGFSNLSTLWHETLAGMQQSENEVVRFFGNVGVVISDFVVNAGEQFRQFAQSMIINWDEVIPQIQSALEGLGAWFADFFTRLPGVLSDISMEMLNTLGIFKLADMIASNPVIRQMGEAVMSFVDFVKDVSADIIKNLGLDKVADAIATALQGAALLASGTAPSGNIPKPGEEPGVFGLPEPQQAPFMGQPQVLTEQQKKNQFWALQKGFKLTHPTIEEFLAGQDITQIPGGRVPGPQTFEQLQQETGIGQNQFTPSRMGVLGGVRQLGTGGGLQSRFGEGFNAATMGPGAAFVERNPMLNQLLLSEKKFKDVRAAARETWEEMGGNARLAATGVDAFNDTLTVMAEEGEITAEEAEVLKQAYQALNTEGEGAATAQKILNGELDTGKQKQEDQLNVMGDLIKSNNDLEETYLQTGKAAMSGNLAVEMQRQGMLEAGQAALNYGMELEKNTAFNKVWGEIIDTNAFKQAAFATGVQKQTEALNKSKVELAESEGLLTEYNRQLATGEPQLIAYNQAVIDTGIALNDTDIKIASTQGHIDAMNQALSTGRPQQQAYRQGWQDVALGMQSTEQEIFNTMGQVDAMNAALQTGVPQAQAYAQGWLSVQQGLQQAVIGLAEARGEIESMNAALAAGIPQGLAFLDGINNIVRGLQDMQVETAGLAGEAARMGQSLGSVEDAQLRLANGFFQGTRSAQDFIANIDIASGSAVGYRTTLEEAAQAAGIRFPEGINLSTESLEKQIAIFKNSVPVIQEYANQINEAGNTLGTMFSPEKLKDINNEVDDWADELRKQWDLKIGKGLEEQITQMNLEGAFETKFTELAGMLEGFIGRSGFEEMGEKVMEFLSNGVENASPQLQASIQEAMNAVREVIANCGGSGSSQGCAAALEGLNNALATFNDNVSTSLGELVTIAETAAGDFVKGFESTIEVLDRLGNKIDVTITKFAGIQGKASEIKQLEGGGAAQVTPTTGVGAGGGVEVPITLKEQPGDLSGPLAQAQQLETIIKGLPGLISAIPAAFAGLNEPMQILLTSFTTLQTIIGVIPTQLQALPASLAGFNEPMQILLTSFTTLQTILGVLPSQFAAAAAGLQAFGAPMQILLQAFTTLQTIIGVLPSQFAALATAFNGATNTMITALQGVGNMALQTGTQIQTAITNGVNAAAAAVNSATNTMITALQGVQNMAAQTAQSFSQIGDAANAAAQVVNSATNTMITALQGVISMADQVAQSIEGIGAAAQQAAGDVDALSDAIRNIPDGDAVIRVTWDVAPAPAGVSGHGVGLSFSRSGTVTYVAASGLGRFMGNESVERFNDLGILAPVLIDHPTKMLVGENGPELVSVTPVSRNNGIGSTGEYSPFTTNRSFARGTDAMLEGVQQGAGPGTTITTQSVVFDQNQGPIQVINQGGGLGTGAGGGGGTGAGSPLTGGGLGTGGTGQQGTFNVPGGGQVSISGNAVACVNGQCFGNMNGFGPALGTPGTGTTGTGTQPQGFQPVRDEETGAIKAIETLIEWFKFLGLPTGASVPGTGNFTNPGTGTITGRGAFASAGQGGAFAGQINMQGGEIVFDSNQGKMQIDTTTGAISIAGQGGAFASAGGAFASAGKVGIFGDPVSEQLNQLNKTMQGVSGSLQAVGNSMASLGDEVVFGNQQMQQSFQQIGGGIGPNFTGGTPVVFQGTGQVGFQPLPGGGGAVGAGGAAGNPIGFLQNTFSSLGLQIPGFLQGGGGTVTPGTGGQQSVFPNVGGIGTGGGGTGGCNVCGAATGLQGAASDLSGAANQLGNVMTSGNGVGAAFPSSGNLGGTGIPTTGGGFPTGGTGGGGTGGTGGPDCSCSCMPMDSDPNRFKIEDPSGRDCNNNIYFNSMAECESRLSQIKANCGGGTTPSPTPTTPTPQPQGPSLGGGVQAIAQGGMAMASAGGVTAVAGGGGGLGQPGMGLGGGIGGMPIGNPPVPPRIVQSAGLPSQHPSVDQDPKNWIIVESMGLVGTYDIVDKSGDVVMLGFRTASHAQEYLNYFISYYKWVKSGSNGIIGGLGGGQGFASANVSVQIPSGGGTLGGGGIPTGNYGGGTGGGLPTGGGGTTQPPPTPPTIRIINPEETTATQTTADKINPANVDASFWKISETTRPDGMVVYFVVITEPQFSNITDTPFASRQDAQNYIDYWRAYQLYIANPPQTFPPQTFPGTNTGGTGGLPTVPTGGTGGGMGTGGGVFAGIVNGQAVAQAGGAMAVAGSPLGGGQGFGGSQKKLGPTPVPDMPFEPIPRAQGPFRSGQDNQEPIFDNSRIKIGADVGQPGDTISMEEIEGGGGGGKKPRHGRSISDMIADRLQRHLDARSDAPAWVQDMVRAIINGFGEVMINLNLDGRSVYKNQKKYIGSEVSLMV